MIFVTCPHCGASLKVAEQYAGNRGLCPACRKPCNVPRPDQVSEGASQADREATLVGVRLAHPPEILTPRNTIAASPTGLTTKSSANQHEEPARENEPYLADSRLEFLAPPQAPDELGWLGPFRVLRILGEGGMGLVLLAEDVTLNRKIAIKVMRPEIAVHASIRKYFLREARAVAAVEDTHIVPIFHVSEERGVPYFTMPLLKGEPLDARLGREKILPVTNAIEIARQTALGLMAAHAAGLVHRDIKPGNIWLEAKTGHVRILDFGIARLVESSHATTGMIVGTPAYMAPEQASGEPIDQRCDLFGLGTMLFQMVTGNPPFRGENALSILKSLAIDTPPAAHTLNPAVPLDLSHYIAQLLEKKPALRPPSAADVAERLAKIAAHARDYPPPLPEPARPKDRSPWIAPRMRPWLVAIALGSVLVIALVLLWPTPKGLVRIESDDLHVKVTFDQDGPTITGATDKPISLRTGEHHILVRNGDISLETNNFLVKKGETTTLKITLHQGAVQVLQNGKLLARRDPPALSTHTEELTEKTPAGKRHSEEVPTGKEPNNNPMDAIAPTPKSLTGNAEYDRIAALPAEQQGKAVNQALKALNPEYQGDLITAIENGQVVDCYVNGAENLRNIAPVAAFGHLREFKAIQSNIADLRPLAGLRLRVLRMMNNFAISDLSPLQGMPLEVLDIWGFVGDDLSPLRDCPLILLNCGGGSRLHDIRPLAGKKLKELWIGHTLVNDLQPLQGLPLEKLGIAYTKVSDLSPLKGMKLRSFDADRVDIKDWSVLKDMPLEEIYLDYRPEQHQELLRSLQRLEKVNSKSVDEFWREVGRMPGFLRNKP